MASKAFIAAMACGALSACSLAPDYKVPETATPPAYEEIGVWSEAAPADALPRTAWWRLYGDATLNNLEGRIEGSNPTLAEAMARYEAAQGFLEEVQSTQLPTLTAGGHATTDR